MSHPSPFKTPEGEASFLAAYDAVLKLWPVQYEEFDIRTRFGTTHVVASGPKNAPPLVHLARHPHDVHADAIHGQLVHALDWTNRYGRHAGARPDVSRRQHFRMQQETLRGSRAAAIPLSDDELRSLPMPVLLHFGDLEVIYNPAQAFDRARRLIADFKAG